MAPSRQQPTKEELALPLGAVLATFAETLLRGRRVALIGNSADDLAERLASASGRRVHVFDPDVRRAGATIATRRGGSDSVSIAPFDDDLGAHTGAFDAVVVPDLAAIGDPAQNLARVASILSPRGVLVLAAENAGAAEHRGSIGYYELYDLVAAHFDHVTMHGEAPFAGYTVANFAVEGEPPVTIDASLMESAEEPSWFVVVASHVAVEVEPYMLVQVPASSVAVDAAVDAANLAELVEAKLQRSLVNAELDKVREREREANRLASEREAAAKKLSARLSELRDEVEETQKRASIDVREARQSVETLQRRLGTAESELERRERDERSRGGQRAELEAAHRGALETQKRELEAAGQSALDRQRRQLEEAHRSALAAQRAAADDSQKKALAAQRVALDEAQKKALAAQRSALAKAQDASLDALRAELEDAHQEELDRMLERIADLEDATDPGAETAPAPVAVVDVRAHEFQLSELKKSLDGARSERDEAKRERARLESRAERAEQLQRALDEARAECVALRGRLAGDGASEDEHALEIERLEKQLVERGGVVTKLKNDVREGERIGRELLARLLEAGIADAAPPNGQASAEANGELLTLRAQLESLAQRCSRYEADLQAASWKIASLTASHVDDDVSDHDKLEDALRVAHEDLAKLRRELEERERAVRK